MGQEHLERVRRAVEQVADAEQERYRAIADAVYHGHTNVEVGEYAGVSGARISQIMKPGAGPERALWGAQNGSMTVAVVQKRDVDSGRAAIVETTSKAVDDLRAAIEPLGIKIVTETVSPPGVIDLNRSNLAVLIGPRISALIIQALSADPVIRWHQDSRSRWYITDTRTGIEYHSDFDEGWQGSRNGRTCVAHIGRIRRPDGHGSFLYIGGAHSPGTAGGVQYLIQEMCPVWEEVRRSPLWSAIIRTEADDDGTPISWERVTPIYTHGRP